MNSQEKNMTLIRKQNKNKETENRKSTEPIDELLTAREAAKKLRVTTATLYQKCRERKIPHLRIGDRVLFRIKEVMAACEVPRTN